MSSYPAGMSLPARGRLSSASVRRRACSGNSRRNPRTPAESRLQGRSFPAASGAAPSSIPGFASMPTAPSRCSPERPSLGRGSRLPSCKSRRRSSMCRSHRLCWSPRTPHARQTRATPPAANPCRKAALQSDMRRRRRACFCLRKRQSDWRYRRRRSPPMRAPWSPTTAAASPMESSWQPRCCMCRRNPSPRSRSPDRSRSWASRSSASIFPPR